MNLHILVLTMTPEDLRRADEIIAHDPSVTSLEEAISWALARVPVPIAPTPHYPRSPGDPSQPPPSPRPQITIPRIRPAPGTFMNVKWTMKEGIPTASLHQELAPDDENPAAKPLPFTVAIDTGALIAGGAHHIAIDPGRHTIVMEEELKV